MDKSVKKTKVSRMQWNDSIGKESIATLLGVEMEFLIFTRKV